MRDYGACCTCYGGDQCFFAVAEVIVGLCWLELVVDDRVNGITDEKVAESSPKVGIESFKNGTKAGSSLVYLSQDLEGVISLLLN